MGLKTIPAIISPELLYVLSSMGHGDEIVLADAHFPTSSVCRVGGAKEIRADGIRAKLRRHNIVPLLQAILKLFPLDEYVGKPCTVMAPVAGIDGPEVPIWSEYRSVLREFGAQAELATVERCNFYEQAKRAFAVVHTGETAKYGNIILKKGLVRYDD